MLLLAVLIVVQIASCVTIDLTEYFNNKIPGLDFNIEAGFISDNNRLFYQLTYKRGTINDISYKAPFIIWLNGGPGCSS